MTKTPVKLREKTVRCATVCFLFDLPKPLSEAIAVAFGTYGATMAPLEQELMDGGITREYYDQINQVNIQKRDREIAEATDKYLCSTCPKRRGATS